MWELFCWFEKGEVLKRACGSRFVQHWCDEAEMNQIFPPPWSLFLSVRFFCVGACDTGWWLKHSPRWQNICSPGSSSITCESVASHTHTQICPLPQWTRLNRNGLIHFYSHIYDSAGILVSCVISFLAYLYDVSSAAAFFPEQTVLTFCQDPEVQLNSEQLQQVLVLPVDTHLREVQGVESFRNSLSVCLHVCWGFQALGVTAATQQ